MRTLARDFEGGFIERSRTRVAVGIFSNLLYTDFMTLEILDSTLRDGALAGDVTLSTEDKLRIAPLIDSLGVTYIEGGWASVFPADLEFFTRAKELNLRARLVAFGATRKPETAVRKDRGLELLLRCETPVVSVYGKVWGLHVEKVLRTSLEENLKMLSDSVAFLRESGREVILMAEHFFDALRDTPDTRSSLSSSRLRRARTPLCWRIVMAPRCPRRSGTA